MSGFGGIVAIDLVGGEAEAEKLFDSFQLIRTAPSLGGVETLVSYPLYSSHAGFSAEQLRAAGVSRPRCALQSVSRQLTTSSLMLRRPGQNLNAMAEMDNSEPRMNRPAASFTRRS